MFDASVLNVVIGLVLIYLLYSLLATALQEILSTVFQRRANTLYRGIKSMLTNSQPNRNALYRLIAWIGPSPGRLLYWFFSLFLKAKTKMTLHGQFYDHPIIKNYGENIVFNKPSYLTSSNFSTILIDTIKNLDASKHLEPETFKLIRDNINAFSNKSPNMNVGIIDFETYKILNYHLNEAAGDLNIFKFRMEKWFNDTMDRVSGWYKRGTQLWLLILGLLMGVVFNLDTVEIVNFLSKNKEAANKLADMGTAIAGNPKYSGGDTIAKDVYDSLKKEVNKVNTLVGLGWGDYGISDTSFREIYLRGHATMKKIYDSLSEGAQTAYKLKRPTINDLQSKIADSAITDSLKREYRIRLDKIRADSIPFTEEGPFSKLFEIDGATIKRQYVLYKIEKHPSKWIGFLITAIAISMGAPFWFDLLNKFVSLRTAVKTVNSSGSTTKNNAVDNNEIDG